MATMSPIPPAVAGRLAKERKSVGRLPGSDPARPAASGAAAGDRRRSARRRGQVSRRPAGARQGLHGHRLSAQPRHGKADVIMLATHGVLGLSNCFAEPAAADLDRRYRRWPDRGLAALRHDAERPRRWCSRPATRPAAASSTKPRTGLADGGDALSGLARGFHLAGARKRAGHGMDGRRGHSSAEIIRLLQGASQPNEGLGKALADAQKADLRPGRDRAPLLLGGLRRWAMAAAASEPTPAARLVRLGAWRVSGEALPA